MLRTAALLAASAVTANAFDPLELVDTRVCGGGFGFGAGSLNPGPQVPNGAMKMGPDTDDWLIWLPFQHFGGYAFGEPYIRAFSHTHMVGAGVGDLANFGVQAFRGPLTQASQVANWAYKTTYLAESEVAKPSFYSVSLTGPSALAELTNGAGTHSGMHRYTFAAGAAGDAALLLDLGHHTMDPERAPIKDARVRVTVQPGDGTDGFVATVDGYVLNRGSLSGRNGRGVDIWFSASYHVQGMTVQVPTATIWQDNEVLPPGTSGGESQSNSLGLHLNFGPTPTNELVVTVRCAISFISAEMATSNRLREAPDNLAFEQAREGAQNMWREVFDGIEIPSLNMDDPWQAANAANLYGALYRANMAPTQYTEQGLYKGFDDEIRTWPYEQAGGNSNFYSDHSLWDSFRTQFSVMALFDPQLALDNARSMLQMGRDGGDLPRWALANVYADSMIGNHGSICIAEYMHKGIIGTENFPLEEMFERMKEQVTTPRTHTGRVDFERYNRDGFVACEANDRAVSLSLSYAYDDWAIGQVAERLNRTEDAEFFARGALSYRNLWNSTVEFMCPLCAETGLHDCPDEFEAVLPYPVATRYVEGNAWQWSWFVPHDVDGLINLFPSTEAYLEKLEFFFSESTKYPGTELPNPYYWAGNEPDIFAPFMFAYAGRSDLTQYWSRYLLDEYFTGNPDGCPGNDDYGTLSSWQLFAQLGFFPQAGSATYVLASPHFEEVVIRPKNGRDIRVIAHDTSKENLYIQRVQLNGRDVPLSRAMIDHNELSGGVLEMWMGPSPNSTAMWQGDKKSSKRVYSATD